MKRRGAISDGAYLGNGNNSERYVWRALQFHHEKSFEQKNFGLQETVFRLQSVEKLTLAERRLRTGTNRRIPVAWRRCQSLCRSSAARMLFLTDKLQAKTNDQTESCTYCVRFVAANECEAGSTCKKGFYEHLERAEKTAHGRMREIKGVPRAMLLCKLLSLPITLKEK